MSFLLDLLKETQAKKKRQILNLKEECEQVRQDTIFLEHMMKFNPYPTYKILKTAKERWRALEFEWIPFYYKQDVLLECLIIRLEKILSRKPGRVPHISYFYKRYLREWNQKTAKTSEKAIQIN